MPAALREDSPDSYKSHQGNTIKEDADPEETHMEDDEEDPRRIQADYPCTDKRSRCQRDGVQLRPRIRGRGEFGIGTEARQSREITELQASRPDPWLRDPDRAELTEEASSILKSRYHVTPLRKGYHTKRLKTELNVKPWHRMKRVEKQSKSKGQRPEKSKLKVNSQMNIKPSSN
ncbi:hypothetical protein Tco_0850080 [Tanacetum coccineum]